MFVVICPCGVELREARAEDLRYMLA